MKQGAALARVQVLDRLGRLRCAQPDDRVQQEAVRAACIALQCCRGIGP